jgi:chemotaxis protein MotB
MAKITTDDSGEIMIPGKPGKSPPPLKPAGKQRRFPFRLWAYAILMTAGTGAGGYYAWQYRDQARDATHDKGELKVVADKAQNDFKSCNTQLDETTKKLADLEGKSKDTESRLSQTSTAKEACDSALKVAEEAKKEADKRLASVAEFQKKFSDMVGSGKLKVVGHHGNLVLELPSEVLFPSGSADLSKVGEYNVVEVGAILKAMPDRRFLVIGHTDSAPLKGSIYKDNWELSTARALTVVRVLVTAGMKPQNLIPAGEGEFDPVSSNSSNDGRQRNRRIEIILLPAITELPPLPAGLEDASAAGAGAKKSK